MCLRGDVCVVRRLKLEVNYVEIYERKKAGS